MLFNLPVHTCIHSSEISCRGAEKAKAQAYITARGPGGKPEVERPCWLQKEPGLKGQGVEMEGDGIQRTDSSSGGTEEHSCGASRSEMGGDE